MFDFKIKYPTIILFEDGLFDQISNEIIKLNPDLDILFATTENFYNLLIKEKKSLVITNDKLLINFTNQISDPEKLSEVYLKNVILFYQITRQFESVINKFPSTFFYPVPLLSNFNQTLNIFKPIFLAVISNFEKEQLLDKISSLQFELSEIKILNEERLSEVETYLTNLELKTLELEVQKEKAEKELELRQMYEKEINKLNEILQDYSIKLNELIKELKSFSYTVSHDLKAPLRGILGYLKELTREHLKEINLNERALYCLSQIQKSAENMSFMIDDLLKYSKLEFETPSLIKCDLNNILNSILSERQPQISKLNADVIQDLQVTELRSWERGLHQVLSNLIDNALKYSAKREKPVVKISSRVDGNDLLLSVEDNGIGFDMSYAEKIFELFKRTPNSSEFEGTGAGLAIVKKIIEKLQGKIWVESDLDKGTIFYIKLPIKEVKDGRDSALSN
jgi:signal transduction histidine kinase